MRRRSVLAGFAALGAGCVGTPSADSTPTANTTTTESGDPSTATARVSNVAATSSPADADLAFDASLVDQYVATGDPAVLQFSIHNTSDQRRAIFAGTVPPFGVPFASAVDDDEQFVLWHDYDSADGCVSFRDGEITYCDIGTVTTLAPDERLTRRYQILSKTTTIHPRHTAYPEEGRYRVADSLSFGSETDPEQSSLDYTATFDIESTVDCDCA